MKNPKIFRNGLIILGGLPVGEKLKDFFKSGIIIPNSFPVSEKLEGFLKMI
jgi:hypothetical protein